MSVNLATKGGRDGQEDTETDTLGKLRAEASKIAAKLERGEISQGQAVQLMNKLLEQHMGLFSRLKRIVR